SARPGRLAARAGGDCGWGRRAPGAVRRAPGAAWAARGPGHCSASGSCSREAAPRGASVEPSSPGAVPQLFLSPRRKKTRRPGILDRDGRESTDFLLLSRAGNAGLAAAAAAAVYGDSVVFYCQNLPWWPQPSIDGCSTGLSGPISPPSTSTLEPQAPFGSHGTDAEKRLCAWGGGGLGRHPRSRPQPQECGKSLRPPETGCPGAVPSCLGLPYPCPPPKSLLGRLPALPACILFQGPLCDSGVGAVTSVLAQPSSPSRSGILWTNPGIKERGAFLNGWHPPRPSPRSASPSSSPTWIAALGPVETKSPGPHVAEGSGQLILQEHPAWPLPVDLRRQHRDPTGAERAESSGVSLPGDFLEITRTSTHALRGLDRLVPGPSLLSVDLFQKLVLIHRDPHHLMPRAEWHLPSASAAKLPLAQAHGLPREQLQNRGETHIQGDVQDSDCPGVEVLPRALRGELRGSKGSSGSSTQRGDQGGNPGLPEASALCLEAPLPTGTCLFEGVHPHGLAGPRDPSQVLGTIVERVRTGRPGLGRGWEQWGFVDPSALPHTLCGLGPGNPARCASRCARAGTGGGSCYPGSSQAHSGMPVPGAPSLKGPKLRCPCRSLGHHGFTACQPDPSVSPANSTGPRECSDNRAELAEAPARWEDRGVRGCAQSPQDSTFRLGGLWRFPLTVLTVLGTPVLLHPWPARLLDTCPPSWGAREGKFAQGHTARKASEQTGQSTPVLGIERSVEGRVLLPPSLGILARSQCEANLCFGFRVPQAEQCMNLLCPPPTCSLLPGRPGSLCLSTSGQAVHCPQLGACPLRPPATPVMHPSIARLHFAPVCTGILLHGLGSGCPLCLPPSWGPNCYHGPTLLSLQWSLQCLAGPGLKWMTLRDLKRQVGGREQKQQMQLTPEPLQLWRKPDPQSHTSLNSLLLLGGPQPQPAPLLSAIRLGLIQVQAVRPRWSAPPLWDSSQVTQRGMGNPAGATMADGSIWQNKQDSHPCASVAGASGFVEPGGSGNAMRRMALRPTAFSGCLNCSKVLELTERLKVLEAKSAGDVGRQSDGLACSSSQRPEKIPPMHPIPTPPQTDRHRYNLDTRESQHEAIHSVILPVPPELARVVVLTVPEQAAPPTPAAPEDPVPLWGSPAAQGSPGGGGLQGERVGQPTPGYPEPERIPGPRCSPETIQLVSGGFLGPLAPRETLAAQAPWGHKAHQLLRREGGSAEESSSVQPIWPAFSLGALQVHRAPPEALARLELWAPLERGGLQGLLAPQVPLPLLDHPTPRSPSMGEPGPKGDPGERGHWGEGLHQLREALKILAERLAGAWPLHPPLAPRPSPWRPDSHRLLFSISHQAPSLQSFLQQQAQLELLARRVTLLEAIIWPEPEGSGTGPAGTDTPSLLRGKRERHTANYRIVAPRSHHERG
ncbi:EMI domain-containing protein 1, partial [Galemys pyrenaicus]